MQFGAYSLAKVPIFSAEFSVNTSPRDAEELSTYGPFQYISVGYFYCLHCSLCPWEMRLAQETTRGDGER